MVASPRPLDDGAPLYIAPTARSQRLMTVLYGVVAVMALLLLVSGALVTFVIAQLSTAAAILVVAVFGVLMLALLVAAVIALIAQHGMVFAVTTQGITLVPPYRRARAIPWSRIAAIEPSRTWMMRGAVVVLLEDGTRLTASQTNASARSAHPPAPAHLGPGNGEPGTPVPLRAALDGLERYRRGEFAGTGVTAPPPPAAPNGPAAPPPSV